GGKQWELSEILSETTYERDGDELTGSGLFVALDGWQWHLVSMHQKVAAAPQPELVEVRAGGDRAGRAKALAAETCADDGLNLTPRGTVPCSNPSDRNRAIPWQVVHLRDNCGPLPPVVT